MSSWLKYTLSFDRNKVYLPFSCVSPPVGMKQGAIALCTQVYIINLVDAVSRKHPFICLLQVKK